MECILMGLLGLTRLVMFGLYKADLLSVCCFG